MTLTANASLLSIQQSGTVDAYGDPGDPQVIWSGSAPGYLKRIRRHALSGGADVEVKRDLFWLLAGAGAPIVEQAGADWEASTVTILDQRVSPPVERTFTVNAMENRSVGSVADNVRLELEQEHG